MVSPKFEEFVSLAGSYGRVVIYREIAGDLITPISLLSGFSSEENLFLLESANLDKSFSRYTFFGYNPKSTVTFKSGLLVHSRGEESEIIEENPVDYLMGLLADESSYKNADMGDFCGGYVGFFGYDMANYMGTLRAPVPEDRENLVMAFMETDEFFVFDNFMSRMYAAVSLKADGNLEEKYNYARKRTLEMAAKVTDRNFHARGSEEEFGREEDFDKNSFVETVRALKEEITAGECIQTVLSNKYEIKCSVNPVNFYRAIRNMNPSPYMYYLKFGDEILCGTSPEIHLKVSDSIATLKPIAGTYRLDQGSVDEIKQKLLNDEKEVAEHLMLLDLARNDLYTGCDTDSVGVLQSFVPEVYSHVVHIVSEVQGKIKEDVPPLKLFCNTFPAGTVSGAPKVRAMELIGKYEKSARGFYAGCAGYFSYSGDLDTCIIIRSALVKENSITFRAGAGIVYDSVPEKEYREVQNKLGVMFDSMKNLSVLEKKNVFTG